MGNYNGAFRVDGNPTIYGPVFDAAKVDILTTGIIVAFFILVIAFTVILPSINFKRMEMIKFGGIYFNLWVLLMIGLALFYPAWQEAKISGRFPYRADGGQQVIGELGIKVGLSGINVTLVGTPEVQFNETIHYNEHFSWTWYQGRTGFGPYSGHINQEHKKALIVGKPLAILHVVEYFTHDGGLIRWGRYFRMGGYYAYVLIWVSLPFWIIANVLLMSAPLKGAYFATFTGLTQLTAVIIYGAEQERPVFQFKIPFENGTLVPTYGWVFYLFLLTAIAITLGGGVLSFFLRRKFLEQERNYVFEPEEAPKATSTDGSMATTRQKEEPMPPPQRREAPREPPREQREQPQQQQANYTDPPPKPPRNNGAQQRGGNDIEMDELEEMARREREERQARKQARSQQPGAQGQRNINFS